MSIAVRLCDVPLHVRMAAAQRCCTHTPDEGERHDLVAAAARPSERVYYVPDEYRDVVVAILGPEAVAA